MYRITSLFLAANPSNMERLNLDIEIREITNKIRLAEYRDSLNVVSAWAVRPDDLLQSLNEHRPQIVHFSGHGSEEGEIVLVNNQGRATSVSAIALKALFEALKDNIQLVILNACYSKIQAEAIIQVIDCAIGMNSAIGDEATITFIARFYGAIAFGKSVKEAFDQGIVALLLEGIPEEHIPELLARNGVDPSPIVLVNTSTNEQESFKKIELFYSPQYFEEPTIYSNSSESDWSDYHQYADNMNFLTYTEWIHFFQLSEKMYREGSQNIEGLIELYRTAWDKVITSNIPEKGKLLSKIETETKRTLLIRESKVEAAPKAVYWKGDWRYSQVDRLSEIAGFASAILDDYQAGKLTLNELRAYYQVGKAILDDKNDTSGYFYEMAEGNLSNIKKIID